MSSARDGIEVALLIVGLAFSASGVLGILRMPDLYTRIQCSSKTITMGALPTLLAVAIAEPTSVVIPRLVLIAGLLLVVNPAASHALARASYKRGVPMWPGAVRDDPRARERP